MYIHMVAPFPLLTMVWKLKSKSIVADVSRANTDTDTSPNAPASLSTLRVWLVFPSGSERVLCSKTNSPCGLSFGRMLTVTMETGPMKGGLVLLNWSNSCTEISWTMKDSTSSGVVSCEGEGGGGGRGEKEKSKNGRGREEKRRKHAHTHPWHSHSTMEELILLYCPSADANKMQGMHVTKQCMLHAGPKLNYATVIKMNHALHHRVTVENLETILTMLQTFLACKQEMPL